MENWFEVNKPGLSRIARRRGLNLVITEMVQNAWDEATTKVKVELVPVAGRPRASLRVEDDSPNGFSDLAHAYTMFAESAKLSDPEKRGRFNIGEKLVLALAHSASVTSTTGQLIFDENGKRRRGRDKTSIGSVLEMTLKMKHAEVDSALAFARTLIPPSGVETWINGELLAAREPIATVESVSLPTEIRGDEGEFRPTNRLTTVRIYDALRGEVPHLYELGIPVDTIDCPWHVEIMQKVPLAVDRASVTSSYQLRVEKIAAEEMASTMSKETSREGWVTEALGKIEDDEAVRSIVTKRFGKKIVSFDPSDPEANKIAIDEGYHVVKGGELPKAAWASVRRAEAIPPAGRVFTAHKVAASPDGVPPENTNEYESWMVELEEYTQAFAGHVVGRSVSVKFYKANMKFAACADSHSISFNCSAAKRLIKSATDLDELLIHECAHVLGERDHLSRGFSDVCCRIGVRLRTFDRTWNDSPMLAKMGE